jgi:hypothetical protein
MEYNIAFRQLAIKPEDSNSWFIQIVKVTEMYNLPSPRDIINPVPNKAIWKRTVYTAINEYWKDQLVKDATTKSTLKLFNFEEFEIGKIHNIWKSCGSDLYAVKRACVKSKIVCGTYTLQADRARFNGQKTTSRCPLCFKEPEVQMLCILPISNSSKLNSFSVDFVVASFTN